LLRDAVSWRGPVARWRLRIIVGLAQIDPRKAAAPAMTVTTAAATLALEPPLVLPFTLAVAAPLAAETLVPPSVAPMALELEEHDHGNHESDEGHVILPFAKRVPDTTPSGSEEKRVGRVPGRMAATAGDPRTAVHGMRSSGL
jgi:hypothetical protein